MTNPSRLNTTLPTHIPFGLHHTIPMAPQNTLVHSQDKSQSRGGGKWVNSFLASSSQQILVMERKICITSILDNRVVEHPIMVAILEFLKKVP